MQNNNYAVTTIDGVYSVTKKDLIVTCENKTVVYGSAAPNYTYVIDGFVSGDSESVLQGEAHFSTIYTDKRGIGEYDILISGFSSDNYDIIYENGVITVTPATITYTLNNYVGEYDNKYHSIYVHNIITVNNMEPTIKANVPKVP